jgi:hypothetical protein
MHCACLRAALFALVVLRAVSAPLLSDVLPAAGGAGTLLNVVGAGLVDIDGETPLCRRVAPLLLAELAQPGAHRSGLTACLLACRRIGRTITPAVNFAFGGATRGGELRDLLACVAPALSPGFAGVAVALNGRDFVGDGLVFEYGAARAPVCRIPAAGAERRLCVSPQQWSWLSEPCGRRRRARRAAHCSR